MLYVKHVSLRLLMASWLAASALLFSAAGHAVDDKTYYQFKVDSVPELNVFHPQGVAVVDLKWITDFPSSVSGGYFRVCSGKEWIKDAKIKAAGGYKQEDLWRFIAPKIQQSMNPGQDYTSNYVLIRPQLNTPYIIRLPLQVDPQTIKESGYKQVSLAARTAYPFGDNCDRTQGVEQDPNDNSQHVLTIKIPVPNLHDATPNIPEFSALDKQTVKVHQDKRYMTVTVPVFGAFIGNDRDKGNTTVAWCDTDYPCDQTHQGKSMEPGVEIKYGVVVVGVKYSVTLPIPTHQDYLAVIKVTKHVTWPAEKTVTMTFPQVTKTWNAPQAKLLSCSDRQCMFQWRSVLPYRDQDGSLGLNFKGGLQPITGKLPGELFTLQDDSWEASGLKLFDQQQQESLAVSNWRQYGENNHEFLTSDPLPREGVIIVRFEPREKP